MTSPPAFVAQRPDERGSIDGNARPVPLEDRPVARESVRRRRVLIERLFGAVVAVAVAAFLWGLVTNPAIRLDVIAEYLFSPAVLQGVLVTLLLSAGSAAIGLVGGLLVALMRLSVSRVIRFLANVYLTVFRATPLLVQILIWYNLASFVPTLSFGIPGTDFFWVGRTNDLISPLTASFLAIGLNQAAYMGEIIRGGLLAVPSSQREAGLGLGMTPAKAFRRVVLPQALRSIVPPMGNELINLLKATSLVAIVGAGDLMTRAQSIYAVTYQVIPMLLVATIWYLVLTTVLSLAQHAIERAIDPLAKSRRPRWSLLPLTHTRRPLEPSAARQENRA